MADLTEHRASGELVFDGALLKVHRDEVRLPDGSRGVREYIRHPGKADRLEKSLGMP